MVHADGDQQAVQEGVDAGAPGAQTHDGIAQENQGIEDQRPNEQQDDGCDDGNQRSSHGDKALAAEECQEVRQLDALEVVVGPRTDQAADDADEGVGDLAESDVLGGILGDAGHDGGDHADAQQLLDHQPGSQAGQSGGSVGFVGHADGNADDEQDLHIVDQGAAGLNQQEADDLCQADDVAALHGGRTQRIANTHQQAADGQHCDGQHQGFAQFLQVLHHKCYPPLCVGQYSRPLNRKRACRQAAGCQRVHTCVIIL